MEDGGRPEREGLLPQQPDGERLSLHVGSGNGSFRGEGMLVDDPISGRTSLEAEARGGHPLVGRDDVEPPQRHEDGLARDDRMQRLHEEDLSGHVCSRVATTTRTVPAEPARPGAPLEDLHRLEDPRTEPGEPPFRRSRRGRARAGPEGFLGADGYAGQHQQTPVGDTGGISLVDWLALPDRPPTFDELIQSWDLTFKGGVTDFVAGQVWGRKGRSSTCSIASASA